ncbi:unnamed protein product [Vicia faba]|uniref:CAAX prenyl protease 2/Lysostaphin resistance protein A-like domain-containing protein n=1 Tax=Vicia faba TaxID=3906 RepID=A0AAV1B0R5_VICFA|nr:unnamed protein product [Vicia faba]
MSVTGWFPAYVKFAPQLDRLAAKPFYNQRNTNCSPQLSFQRNSLKRCYCKKKEQDTQFLSDSPWDSGDDNSLFFTHKLRPYHLLPSKFLSLMQLWFYSTLGFGFLVLLICLTSLLGDRLFDFKSVSNPSLKEILLNSDISRVCCVVAYCIVTPLLEEVVYRGFLLKSLSSTMKWQQAVAISSVIFSAIHFSGENFVQLFIIGCVLGCSYSWTENLNSSIVIHSLYNALTLLITYFY